MVRIVGGWRTEREKLQEKKVRKLVHPCTHMCPLPFPISEQLSVYYIATGAIHVLALGLPSSLLSLPLLPQEQGLPISG